MFALRWGCAARFSNRVSSVHQHRATRLLLGDDVEIGLARPVAVVDQIDTRLGGGAGRGRAVRVERDFGASGRNGGSDLLQVTADRASKRTILGTAKARGAGVHICPSQSDTGGQLPAFSRTNPANTAIASTPSRIITRAKRRLTSAAVIPISSGPESNPA
jgi:hypothetical protein